MNVIIETMECEINKGKPLTRQEIKSLLDLIEGSKVVTNRTTNAVTNKLKTDEWNRITEQFNATVASCPRTPQQLRLKWENLKKNARKRKSLGSSSQYIHHPDEIADRVSTILSNTVEGLTVHFGGDADSRDGSDDDVIDAFVVKASSREDAAEGSRDPLKAEVLREIEVDLRDASACFALREQDKYKCVENTTRVGGLKRKLKQDEGRTARNVAIAEYYTVKKKLLQGKLDNIILQNEKLRLELEILKQSL